MLGIARIGSLLLLLLALGHAQAGEYGTVARVNGEPIDAQRFESYYQAFLTEKGRNPANIRDPRAFENLRREALNAYIDEELLWQDARKQGLIAAPEDVEARVAQLNGKYKTADEFRLALERGGQTEDGLREQLKRQLSTEKLVLQRIAPTVKVSFNEVRGFYRKNREKFSVPEQVRVRHILVKLAASASPAERMAAKDRISQILAEAKRPGADFAALAKRDSQDATAERGGDLGFISRGQTVPAFEQAAFALKDGQLSEVVETEFGLHILRREAHRQGVLREAEVRSTVRQYLAEEKTRQAVRQHLDLLRKAAKIETAESR